VLGGLTLRTKNIAPSQAILKSLETSDPGRDVGPTSKRLLINYYMTNQHYEKWHKNIHPVISATLKASKNIETLLAHVHPDALERMYSFLLDQHEPEKAKLHMITFLPSVQFTTKIGLIGGMVTNNKTELFLTISTDGSNGTNYSNSVTDILTKLRPRVPTRNSTAKILSLPLTLIPVHGINLLDTTQHLYYPTELTNSGNLTPVETGVSSLITEVNLHDAWTPCSCPCHTTNYGYESETDINCNDCAYYCRNQ